MTWFGWFYLAMQAFGSFWIISQIGKPRKSYDHGDACLSLAIGIAMVVGALTVGTGHL